MFTLVTDVWQLVFAGSYTRDPKLRGQDLQTWRPYEASPPRSFLTVLMRPRQAENRLPSFLCLHHGLSVTGVSVSCVRGLVLL